MTKKNNTMNCKTTAEKYRICILCIFSAMFILLWEQFRTVHIYFDDYAYYSLSYALTYSATRNFTLPQLFVFLKEHYMECNGRLLYFFVWLFLYWLGGLNLVRLGAAAILTGTLYTLWMAASRQLPMWERVYSAIGICVMYCLLDVIFLAKGIYWFCAFFLYVTPICCLTAASLVYFGNEKAKEKKYVVLALIFLAGWSQEQQAAATIAFAVLLALHSILFKKEKLTSVYMFCRQF